MSYHTHCAVAGLGTYASPNQATFTQTYAGTTIAADFYVVLVNIGDVPIRYGASDFATTANASALLMPGETSPQLYVVGTTNGGSSSLWLGAGENTDLVGVSAIITELS